MTTALNRTTVDAPAADVRLLHLGLGAFHRAHQVWYTQAADPEWGYASFTGRGPLLAEQLTPQDGLYHLIVRSGEGDEMVLMRSLVDPQPASNQEKFAAYVADPQVAVITLTVTEAGYYLRADGTLDTSHADVEADLEAYAAGKDSLSTAAGRIVAGLARRRETGAGIAVMSCDNVADNGRLTRNSVVGFAREVDPELADWIDEHVSFPSTSIDRITPATTEDNLADVARVTGFDDAAPVVTEPFASWVIEGDFPAGRPAWERAGVEFVSDIEPFERRKLWLLNGSHSLMAYFGQLRGHATVAEAIGDPVVREKVEALWDAAAHHLTEPGLDIPGYRSSLIERFENPRIRHNLAQIAIDGATKQRMRAAAIALAELKAGRDGKAALFSIAAWIAYVRRGEVQDTQANALAQAVTVEDFVRILDPQLAGYPAALEAIEGFLTELVEL